MDPACLIPFEADLVSYRPQLTSGLSLAVGSGTRTTFTSVIGNDGAAGGLWGGMMMVVVVEERDTEGGWWEGSGDSVTRLGTGSSEDSVVKVRGCLDTGGDARGLADDTVVVVSDGEGLRRMYLLPAGADDNSEVP